ncbi:uncharacterized protein LOC112592888, partial [Melanaphis sacchari]|uniref:uncharacterized protein LOC112592888 n=1 Tax=Melanaphis sacchari TaxID=742174 RepID=UPI000DC1423E
DDFDKYAIRENPSVWFNRELPTLDKILTVVNEDKSLPNFSRTSLYRLMKSMEFEYAKRGRNSAEEGRQIYFLDETWVNAGDVTSRIWSDNTVQSSQDAFSQGLSTGAVNPTGKGKRLIVVHIGSEDGFVPGGLLCFESKKNTQDYHDEMNGDSFRDWLEGVLPRLKENCVIVMDNAPYHSMKKEKYPTTQWRKADIINWLTSKGEVIDNSMIIPELLEVVKRLKPLYSTYVIDEMVKEQNKVVLRLPPFHCELNPIELAWSVVKDHVKANNKTYKLADVHNLLIEGTVKVTVEMWKNFISHTTKAEDKFWDMDNLIDELMAEQHRVVPLIIE